MKKNQLLLNLAVNSMNNAHAPYSNFKVGAAILADNGKTYSGCNVENISYPCGTCAEAGAIAAMVADGGKKIVKIIIVSDGDIMITPCGACLQRIKEFSSTETEIILTKECEEVKTVKRSDLLPLAFEDF